MTDSPFEDESGAVQHFTTPQLEDVFQSVLSEIENLRPLSCVIGFPKAGKTTFLMRLKDALTIEVISLVASTEQTLFHELMMHTTPEGETKPVLSKILREKKRIILMVDNAHLLTDGDYAFLASLYGLAEKHESLLQVILVGNGEIVHRLARPDNRTIYAMLGAIWNLPKLTREQSREYISFVLGNAGLAADLISNTDALVKRAAGVIGILRMLTVTLALKALGSRESCDAEDILECAPDATATEGQAREESFATQRMTTGMSRWTGLILALSMAAIISLLVVFLSWLMPGLGVMDLIFGTDDATGSRNHGHPTPGPGRKPDRIAHAPGRAKTVFRKRTKDGPYSVQIGSFATMEALLLHLPRFTDLDRNLFWNHETGQPERYTLFTGRFESFEEARDYAARHDMEDAQVVFRPFVGTVGPLTDQEQIRRASLLVGLREPLKVFEHELVSGVEIQFALERSREDALNHCLEAEKKGLSCAVPQYE
jgi:type II secretory pathway predicted ATPase ExeA